MTPHPYIGRTFRVQQYPYKGDDAGKNDIPRAVCVFIAQAGSTATEDGCGYAAAYMRLPDGTHKEVFLTDLVGPIDEPAPAVATREKWETVTLPYWERPVDLPDSSAVEVGAWRPLAPATEFRRLNEDTPDRAPDIVIVWTRRLLFAVEGA